MKGCTAIVGVGLVGNSSSGIPASACTVHVRATERCLVAHPVNPPCLAPVAEVEAAEPGQDD